MILERRSSRLGVFDLVGLTCRSMIGRGGPIGLLNVCRRLPARRRISSPFCSSSRFMMMMMWIAHSTRLTKAKMYFTEKFMPRITHLLIYSSLFAVLSDLFLLGKSLGDVSTIQRWSSFRCSWRSKWHANSFDSQWSLRERKETPGSGTTLWCSDAFSFSDRYVLMPWKQTSQMCIALSLCL